MSTKSLSNWESEQAQEGFMYEVQYAIALLMREKNVKQADLARALGQTPSYVSQLLNDEGRNLSTRTIGRIFAILGEEVNVTSPALEAARAKIRQKALEDIPPQKYFCGKGINHITDLAMARACSAKQSQKDPYHLDDGENAPSALDMSNFADASDNHG